MAVQTFRHAPKPYASGRRLLNRPPDMLAPLRNAASGERILAWRKSGPSISLYDRSRKVVRGQDPVLRGIAAPVDRSALARLNRAIAEQGWREFLDTPKCRTASVRVCFAESSPVGLSQDCSHHGSRVSKALSERSRRCGAYGLELDRDENAARSVLSPGLRIVAETVAAGGEARCAPAASTAR